MRAGVWRTKDISIGGKNPTNVSFASIGNQVFLDRIKYFQQSLASLVNSLTDDKRMPSIKNIENVSAKINRFLENLISVPKKTRSGYSSTYRVKKVSFHMK